MAIPPEFNYESEDDFTQNFLIPLLQKLGFSLVINYHGKSEFGKDLIFAEVDRFGHIRYHGLQAKYVSSISLNGIEEVINDCKQAFENPFIHPQNGASERISSFYAVNGGSVSPEASQHYFNSLLKLYGGNVRLLQAKDLLTLDRWASASSRDRIAEQLTGLLIELDLNKDQIGNSIIFMRSLLAGTGGWNIGRLRVDTSSAYLRHPFMTDILEVEQILAYWNNSLMCNKEMDLVLQGILDPEVRRTLTENAIKHLQLVQTMGIRIRERVNFALQSLAPRTNGK